MPIINVLLVDDHELVRTGIAALLNAAESISVVGIANSGEQALVLAEQLTPDVILMDVNMPGIGGVEACRRILETHSAVKILALSAFNDISILDQMLKQGAMGFISKNSSVEEMVSAIRKVMNGEPYLCKNASNSQAEKKSGNNPFAQLSKREVEVTRLMLDGRSITEMAQILNISAKTISTYRSRVNEKLNVKNDAELFRLAVKWNYL